MLTAAGEERLRVSISPGWPGICRPAIHSESGRATGSPQNRLLVQEISPPAITRVPDLELSLMNHVEDILNLGPVRWTLAIGWTLLLTPLLAATGSGPAH